MHFVIFFIPHLLLSLCECHTNERLKIPPTLTLIPRTLTGLSKLSTESLTYRTNSSELNAVPTALRNGNHTPTSATVSRTCHKFDTFCSTTEVDFDGIPDINLSDQCILWDPSCSGNITEAKSKFFNHTIGVARFCFERFSYNETAPSLCEKFTGIRDRSRLKSWMRSTQCLSTAMSWEQNHPPDYDQPLAVNGTCCGVRRVYGTTVDLFYWPDPSADDSCLSIIENTVYPLDAGATVTTDWVRDTIRSKATYWGCTLRTPTVTGSLLTTASLEVSSGTSLKVSLVNPWDTPDCFNVSKPHATSRVDTKPLKMSETQSYTEPELPLNYSKNALVTAVSNGYTL